MDETTIASSNSSPQPVFYLAVFVVAAVMAALWLWLPKFLVGTKDINTSAEKYLELMNAYRSTTGVALAGIGFLATFVFSVIKYFDDRNETKATNDFRYSQSLLAEYSSALKNFVPEADAARVAALYEMQTVATARKEFTFRVRKTINQVLYDRAATDRIRKVMSECSPPQGSPQIALSAALSDGVREPVDAVIQVGMDILGQEESKALPVRLDHRYLDDVAVGNAHLENAELSQSHLRRASLRGSYLQGAWLGGVSAGANDVVGYSEALGASLNDNTRIPEWQKYRCWVTDFRDTHLQGAHFEGAGLIGAVFSGAEVDGKTRFDQANISWADFRKVKGLSPDHLAGACVKPKEAQPLNDFDPSFTVKTCG